MRSVAVIVVTHNSEKYLPKCLAALDAQSVRPFVIIVDSGSTDTSYLSSVGELSNKRTIYRGNIGFAAANNVGWALCQSYDYVLFLNPDAFLPEGFIEQASALMEQKDNADVGAVSGSLLGYDIEADKPTGLIDSTSVVQNWYGRFKDRDQRMPVQNLRKYHGLEQVGALCGALIFSRNDALRKAAFEGQVFDSKYFMYKEDIDLSWRLRKAGWRLLYDPVLWAYHCRGWGSRSSAPRSLKILSARNEMKLFVDHRSPYILYAILKYALVRTFGI